MFDLVMLCTLVLVGLLTSFQCTAHLTIKLPEVILGKVLKEIKAAHSKQEVGVVLFKFCH